jgi:hypothetical protein
MNATAIVNAIRAVTKKWARQCRREEREANAAANRRQALTRSLRVSIKDVAYEVMEWAYMEVSGGRLPARPRQIMYAARPTILDRTGRESLDDQYFTQTLLPDFMAENPETTARWDIAWDDRGHFAEPHTGRIIGLGTLAVRKYLQSAGAGVSDDIPINLASSMYPTIGPLNRFRAVLFIEKEGFLPLFEAVRLEERFDIAVMSTKGLSTTAGRTIVDRLCGEHGIPLLVLHDFDKSGFSIVGTLRRDTRRYMFVNKLEVIELGLRLDDVTEHQLQSEHAAYGKSDPAPNLRENGATEEDINFLCSQRHWTNFCGQRVELNAFTSRAFVAWIERKLQQHGITKVVPEATTLEHAYRRVAAIATINNSLPELVAKTHKEAEGLKVPASIVSDVQKILRDNPAMPWDAAVAELVHAIPR